jgi:type IV pilus assembly protein PilC
VFDDLYVSMVKCGERDGRLPETIGRLAGFLEASTKLRRKIKAAMAYPIIVLFISAGITGAMLVFVVPVLGDVYASLGAELPASTMFLMGASGVLKKYGPHLVVLVAVCLFLFRKWRRTVRGHYVTDWMLMRLPVFGDLNRKILAARFARAFGDLVRGGVPILAALEVGAGATGNKVSERLVLACGEALVEGRTLSSAMPGQNVFPETFVEMLQAGEETGKIDEMMDCIGEFYEEEVDATISGLTALLEPILMVLLGILIGGMVVCLFMPIFLLPGAIG